MSTLKNVVNATRCSIGLLMFFDLGGILRCKFVSAGVQGQSECILGVVFKRCLAQGNTYRAGGGCSYTNRAKKYVLFQLGVAMCTDF